MTGVVVRPMSIAERSSTPPSGTSGSLVVVANRLPVSWAPDQGWTRAPGGLVTALEAVVKRRGVEWFGSVAALGGDGQLPTWSHGPLHPVMIDGEVARLAVAGMANSALWPSLHGLRHHARWRDEWWDAYRRFNRRFATAVAATAEVDATVWVHDFHLLLVPALLADLRPDLRVGLSLHTPVDAAALRELPVIDELTTAMSDVGLIGTQTERDRDAVLDLVGSVDGDRVVVSPVSVEPAELEAVLHDPATALAPERFIGRPLTSTAGRQLVVGVDRMDYTKSIPERLTAIEHAFHRGWLDPERVDIVQIAQSSRADVPAYRRERLEIERLGHAIASHRLRADGTSPLRVVTEPIDRRIIVGLLAAADVAVVTPVRDGMNLVAKEFSIVNERHGGVLVLSTGAGAAAELGDFAVTVDGADVIDVARGLQRAVGLDAAQRRRWAVQRAAAVRAWTASDWSSAFCSRLHALDRAAS